MAAIATSTISSTIKDLSGTALEGVEVIARLKPDGQAFRESDSSGVASEDRTTTDSNGAWSLALERNANVTPDGSWYLVTEMIPLASGGPKTYAISVGDSNQTLLAALITEIPEGDAAEYLTQAAADARYQQLGSLGSGSPADVVQDGDETAGVATSASRSDHAHAFPPSIRAPLSFADATARTAAGASIEQPGLFVWMEDSERLDVFDGTSWLPWETLVSDSFTPALSASTPPTLGSGSTQSGEWGYRSGMVEGRALIGFGSSGVNAGSGTYTVSLPAAAHADAVILGEVFLFDAAPARRVGQLVVNTSTTGVLVYDAGTIAANNAPWTWAANDSIRYRFRYRPA